jgi:hypothetical protein
MRLGEKTSLEQSQNFLKLVSAGGEKHVRKYTSGA